MGGRKKRYTAQFKAKVAFEAAKGDRNITEIASEYGIHPQQVRTWRRVSCPPWGAGHALKVEV